MSDYKIGSIVPLSENSKDARMAVALKGMAELTAERDQLRAELEKLRGELDDAEERASEAEERCAAEWEKDCGQALRILAQVTDFEWDQDGSPADEVREHIQLTLESQKKQVASLRAELARLTQANADLRKERERAVAEAQRQDGVAKGLRKELRKLFEQQHHTKLIGAAEWLSEFAGDADGEIRITHAWLRERAAQLRQEAGE